jgi:cellulose biosynthesis protein BcsQ
MKKSTPDDIAALCSHVNVDRSRYHVFSRENTDVQQVMAVPTWESSSGDSVESDAPPITRPESKSGTLQHAQQLGDTRASSWATAIASTLMSQTVGPRLVPPLRLHYSERRALRNLWRTTDERTALGGVSAGLDRVKHQAVSVFQAAGGTGATTISATLAKLFSRRQERVLIVDCNAESILPFYFGMKSVLYASQSCVVVQNPQDASLYIFASDLRHSDSQTEEMPGFAARKQEFASLQREVDRTLFDMPSKALIASFQEFCTSGLCLVVAVPDLSSVIGVQKLDKYLNQAKPAVRPVYILNKFDHTQPLHIEIYDWLADHSRDRRVITIRRTDEVSEALAEGITVMDYAPGSGIAEDYFQLGETVRELTEIKPATKRSL